MAQADEGLALTELALRSKSIGAIAKGFSRSGRTRPDGYPQTPPYEWWSRHDDRTTEHRVGCHDKTRMGSDDRVGGEGLR